MCVCRYDGDELYLTPPPAYWHYIDHMWTRDQPSTQHDSPQPAGTVVSPAADSAQLSSQQALTAGAASSVSSTAEGGKQPSSSADQPSKGGSAGGGAAVLSTCWSAPLAHLRFTFDRTPMAVRVVHTHTHTHTEWMHQTHDGPCIPGCHAYRAVCVHACIYVCARVFVCVCSELYSLD